MTVIDLLLYIRQQLLEVRAGKDATRLREIWLAIDLFVEVAYQTKDKAVAGFLEDMGDSIRDSLIDEEWKSTIPTEEEIKKLGSSKD